jgi:hypothetical protein
MAPPLTGIPLKQVRSPCKPSPLQCRYSSAPISPHAPRRPRCPLEAGWKRGAVRVPQALQLRAAELGFMLTRLRLQAVRGARTHSQARGKRRAAHDTSTAPLPAQQSEQRIQTSVCAIRRARACSRHAPCSTSTGPRHVRGRRARGVRASWAPRSRIETAGPVAEEKPGLGPCASGSAVMTVSIRIFGTTHQTCDSTIGNCGSPSLQPGVCRTPCFESHCTLRVQSNIS